MWQMTKEDKKWLDKTRHEVHMMGELFTLRQLTAAQPPRLLDMSRSSKLHSISTIKSPIAQMSTNVNDVICNPCHNSPVSLNITSL